MTFTHVLQFDQVYFDPWKFASSNWHKLITYFNFPPWFLFTLMPPNFSKSSRDWLKSPINNYGIVIIFLISQIYDHKPTRHIGFGDAYTTVSIQLLCKVSLIITFRICSCMQISSISTDNISHNNQIPPANPQASKAIKLVKGKFLIILSECLLLTRVSKRAKTLDL